jgi:general stress protein YciG
MDPNQQREIASKGGKAAHVKGTAFQWTSEQAREAGRKGGIASHRKRELAARADMPSAADGRWKPPIVAPRRGRGLYQAAEKRSLK